MKGLREMKPDWKEVSDNELETGLGGEIRRKNYTTKEEVDESITPISSEGIDTGKSLEDRTVGAEAVSQTLKKLQENNYSPKNEKLYNNLLEEGFTESEAQIADFMFSVSGIISNKEYNSIEEFKEHYRKASKELGKAYGMLKSFVSNNNPELKEKAYQLNKKAKDEVVEAVAEKYKEFGYKIKD